ncbi:DNA recombination protein RmuC [Cryptosporangium aurantiacum]|uniref:DNA recombination protein RmuC n=2 Tax=Cryptosporangium aurantiacum TaxID=134849 RepID=A0A1M7QRD7_9ACTN|nr:DNA recombination protein RmuC [Cryptosporangium aurantiacum]
MSHDALMSTATLLGLIVVALVCLAAGAAAGWFAAMARNAAETAGLRATVEASRAGEERLEQALRAVSAEAIERNNSAFSQLVGPIRESIANVEHTVVELERDRAVAHAALREQVNAMQQTGEKLRVETGQLVSALKAPQVRGRWGEHQLRRIVEVAGMVEHCDFVEQATSSTEDGILRPDLVVTLAGGKSVVVDAKVPFAAYLEAMEARDERDRSARMQAHARHLRTHVEQLAAKAYWQRFEPTPEFVVLFVPADTFLDAALQREPNLLEHAFSRNIVVATPSTLIALLRTIAYTWRQEALAENAAAVHALGRDLYQRLSTMGGHVDKLGSALGNAVARYNDAVGSLEARVLVSARRFTDLQVATSDIAAPRQVEAVPRALQAPELVD